MGVQGGVSCRAEKLWVGVSISSMCLRKGAKLEEMTCVSVCVSVCTGSRSGSSRGSMSRRVPPVEHKLQVPLEDLYSGCTRKMKITRQLLNGKSESEVLEIDIKPGWKSGTKVTFPEKGRHIGYAGQLAAPFDSFACHDVLDRQNVQDSQHVEAERRVCVRGCPCWSLLHASTVSCVCTGSIG